MSELKEMVKEIVFIEYPELDKPIDELRLETILKSVNVKKAAEYEFERLEREDESNWI